jgi:formylglycine-generating enzyme required for sulfatase activity
MAVSGDGRLLFSGADDGDTRLWNVSSGEQLARFKAHAGEISAIAVSADGRTGLTGGVDGFVRVWNLQEKCLSKEFASKTIEPVYAVALSPDDHFAAWGGHDQAAYIWGISRSDIVPTPSADQATTELKAPVAQHGFVPELLVAPFDERQAQAAQKQWSDRLNLPVEMTNSIGMRLRLIPAGHFRMGVAEDADLFRPEHPVRITRPFYLGSCEVTRGQFANFVKHDNQSMTQTEPGGRRLDNTGKLVWDAQVTWQSPGFPQDDSHPVVDVSWYNAQQFCAWLSRVEGKQYRLPTEAEWEYTCRAGTTTWNYYGNSIGNVTEIANIPDLSTKTRFPAWNGVKSSDGFVFTSPVGRFRPNNFGLYDMVGNVHEWCFDWTGEGYYKRSPLADPQGEASGRFRALRGGCFNMMGSSAGRWSRPPDFLAPDIGFRVVCDIPDAPSVAPPAPIAAAPPAGDERRVWRGEDSVFRRTQDGIWREEVRDAAIYVFDEVKRTAEHVELIDKTRATGGCRVRLLDHEAQMIWSGRDKDWQPLQVGEWDAGSALKNRTAKGFLPLFTDRNMMGWQQVRSAHVAWRVEADGTLIGKNSGHTKGMGGFLITARADYSDFHLRCEAMLSDGPNGSAILFRRNPADLNHGEVAGYLLFIPGTQQTTFHAGQKINGSVLVERKDVLADPLAEATKHPVRAGKWFRIDLIAQGPHIEVKIDGRPAVDVVDPNVRRATGAIGFACRPDSTVRFRNVEIKELTSRTGS